MVVLLQRLVCGYLGHPSQLQAAGATQLAVSKQPRWLWIGSRLRRGI
jgi:hypothetical protein